MAGRWRAGRRRSSKSPAATPREQRGAAGAGLDDRRRLDGAEARLGGEHGLVARPAAGDDDLACAARRPSSMWASTASTSRADGVDRAAPDRARRDAVGQAQRAGGRASAARARARARRRERWRARPRRARAAASAMPSCVEDLLQGEAGPEAAEQRLAALGHVPADGDARRRRSPAHLSASSGGATTRTSASAVPQESSTSPGRHHAHADAGDEVVVAGDGEHGAVGAGQRRRRRCARRACPARHELGEEVVGQPGPRERVGERAPAARGRAGRCARRATARRPRRRRGGARPTRPRSASAPPRAWPGGARRASAAWPASTARLAGRPVRCGEALGAELGARAPAPRRRRARRARRSPVRGGAPRRRAARRSRPCSSRRCRATRPSGARRARRAPRRRTASNSASASTSAPVGHALPGRRRLAVGALDARRASTTAALQAEVPTSMPEQEVGHARSGAPRPAAGRRSPRASPSSAARARAAWGTSTVSPRPRAAARRPRRSVPAPSATTRIAKPRSSSTAGARRDALGAEEGVGRGGQQLGDGAVAGRRRAAAGGRARRARRCQRDVPAEAERRLVLVVDAEAVPLEQDREVGRLLELDDEDARRRSRAAMPAGTKIASPALHRQRVSAPSSASWSCVARPSARASAGATSSRKPTCDRGAGPAAAMTIHASVLP